MSNNNSSTNLLTANHILYVKTVDNPKFQEVARLKPITTRKGEQMLVSDGSDSYGIRAYDTQKITEMTEKARTKTGKAEVSVPSFKLSVRSNGAEKSRIITGLFAQTGKKNGNLFLVGTDRTTNAAYFVFPDDGRAKGQRA